MQVYNQTPFVHQFTMAMDKAGHEWILLVVKGTFAFPDAAGAVAVPADDQIPLVMADEYTGAPGFSAPLRETDFAFRKPACDIVLTGAAHAPGGRPATAVRVGLRVGGWSKVFDVLGHREWRARGPLFAPTSPEPFLARAISYDTAWGGTDRLDPDDPTPPAWARNPVGTGWASLRNQSRIPGLALPATQALGETITTPFGDYTPMSFGPMGRGWPGRIEWGGTYDQHWIDEIFPFLPPDFDDRYFQMAPPDQQTTRPQGGEDVILVNLTARGREHLRLPDTRLPLTLFRGRGIDTETAVLPDTIAIDADARRLALVWRISARIRRTILDFTEAWVGPPTNAMLRARREGRTYIRAANNALPYEEDA